VRSRTVDTGELNESGGRKTAKGYSRAELFAVWQRYVVEEKKPS
jgi:hypothetical protein